VKSWVTDYAGHTRSVSEWLARSVVWHVVSRVVWTLPGGIAIGVGAVALLFLVGRRRRRAR
jgi:hypothetical protein